MALSAWQCHSRFSRNYGKSGFAVVLSIVAAVVVAFIALKEHVFRNTVFENRTVTFTSRPKVLIVYSYDCKEYSDCIVTLARFLTKYANAEVSVDQFELNAPGLYFLS